MFVYFDLGNVLLHFSHRQACEQMAQVASRGGRHVSPDEVWSAVFDSGLEDEFEAGRIGAAEFYERFAAAVGTRPDFEQLALAGSEIFRVNRSIVPVLGALAAARYRLGIVSNTNPLHWAHLTRGQYDWLPHMFDTVVLSYQVGALKPEPAIYQRATQMAGVPPQEIFFTDDREEHVHAARQAGWHAVPYTDTPTLVRELRRAGIEFNY
jgi:HAD superfamily hydrolase (TIGR01509 family)